MADVFTPELTFGQNQSGMLAPTSPGAPYRTIQITGGGTALSASNLIRTSGVTSYPFTFTFSRPADWYDGIIGVAQRSQDPLFLTGVTEVLNTLTAAVTTYDFGEGNIVSGIWYMRLAAYAGSRPATLNWSNVIGVGDAVAPTITSTNAPSGYQFVAGTLALTANKAVTWAIVGGFDMAQFSLSGSSLPWLAQSLVGTYTVQVQATSYFNVTSAIQTITLTVAINTASAFTFTDETTIALSTLKTSNTITVAGIGSGSIAVSVVGGTYSKNGGAFTSAAGTAINGDTFAVQQTSSSSYSTSTNTTLTIGSTSDTYTVTTMADPLAIPAFAWTDNPAMIDGASGPSVTFTGVAIGAADPTRQIIVFVTNTDNIAADTFTVGGVTATLLKSELDLFVYQAAVPTGTTATIVFNRVAGIRKVQLQVCSLTNYNATPSSTGSVAFGSSDPNSVTPTIPAGGVAVGAIIAEGAALTITVSAGTAGLQTQTASTMNRTMRGASRTTAGNLTFTGQGGGGNCLCYAVYQP